MFVSKVKYYIFTYINIRSPGAVVKYSCKY